MVQPDDAQAVPAAPATLRGNPSFVRLWCVRTATTGAYQMQGVAIGWQLYEMTGNPLDLGIIGLVQFLPLVGFSPLIGQVADRYDRRRVAAICQIIRALCAAALAFGTLGGWLGRETIFAIVFLAGSARAFEMPGLHALVPTVVPPLILPHAIAASSTAQQTAVIAGPAIGGMLYLLGPVTVYATCTVISLLAVFLVIQVKPIYKSQDKAPVTFKSVFAGFTYIWNRKLLLGVISLDLFAVLVSGVTALLPIFARDVLETGPWGLGLLRSAPAVGALTMSAVLARWSIEARAGQILFATVAAYGAAITLFGLSTSLVLSLMALVAYGAADAVSVVIRHSLVQTQTPNEMLGRVMAVNLMFTGTSGSLGDFRAGVMAACWGAVPAVLIGGIGAMAVTLVWMRAFPELIRIQKLTGESGRSG
jgi:MFS family permease